jgi:hypothetical protein
MTSETQERQELLEESLEVDLPNDKSKPITDFLSWDYKLFWLVLSIIASLAVGVASKDFRATAFMAGGLAILNVAMFWAPLFDGWHTTFSAWALRTGSHKAREMLRHNEGRSQELDRGQVAIHVRQQDAYDPATIPIPALRRSYQRRTIRLPDGIGKVIFFPTDVGQSLPMGWAWHEKTSTWVATAETEWYPWRPASVEARRRRLLAFGRMADFLASNDNSLVRLVIQDRTIVKERIRFDTDLQPFIERRSRHSQHARRAAGEAYAVELLDEVAGQAIEHHTTITVAIRRRIKPGRQAPRPVISQCEQFYKHAMGRGVGLQSLSPLSHNQLVLEFTNALDPVFVERNWELLQDWTEDDEFLDPSLVLSSAWKEELDHYRYGETIHSGWEVIGTDTNGKLAPDSLWSVVGEPYPKTVTTVVEMIPLAWSKKWEVMGTTSVVRKNVDKADKKRLSDFDVVEEERAREYERRLARGGGMVSRSKTYVDFTGTNLKEVRANASAVESKAKDSDILLRPLTGTQRDGLGAALPLALGLQSGRAQSAATAMLQSSNSSSAGG